MIETVPPVFVKLIQAVVHQGHEAENHPRLPSLSQTKSGQSEVTLIPAEIINKFDFRFSAQFVLK